MSDVTPFKSIKQSEEKMKIFSNLVDSGKPFVGKTLEPDSDLVAMIPEKLENGHLICSSQITVLRNKSLSNLIIQFVSGSKKYMAQLPAKRVGKLVHLNIIGDLFTVQRREDFRLTLPRSYGAIFAIEKHNGKTEKRKWPAVDISAGGCRIETDDTLRAGDTISGKLHLTGRSPIPVAAVARHRKVASKLTQSYYIGLHFTDVTEFSKDRLAGLVIDLYRELFAASRFKS